MDAARGRAFISTYQKLGFIIDDKLVVIGPQKYLACYLFDRKDGNTRFVRAQDAIVNDMLSYYQGASYVYKNGLNRISPNTH